MTDIKTIKLGDILIDENLFEVLRIDRRCYELAFRKRK
jgi:hypothetical protein